jgi:hypothetical protein
MGDYCSNPMIVTVYGKHPYWPLPVLRALSPVIKAIVTWKSVLGTEKGLRIEHTTVILVVCDF